VILFSTSKLLETLEKYNIKKEQLYSITCDNAANMIKLARIMNDETNQVHDCIVMTSENVNNSEPEDDDLWQYDNEGTPLATDDIENELFNGMYCFFLETFLNALIN